MHCFFVLLSGLKGGGEVGEQGGKLGSLYKFLFFRPPSADLFFSLFFSSFKSESGGGQKEGGHGGDGG